MRTILRHLVPVCVTTAFILVAWMIVTLPLVAVFLIDDAFVVSEYLKFIVYAAGISLGVSSLVMFPLSLLLERLVMWRKWLAVVPPLLLALSVICLAGCYGLTHQFLDTVFGWTGFFFAFALAFSVYWGVLWLVKALIYGVHKLRDSDDRELSMVSPMAVK